MPFEQLDDGDHVLSTEESGTILSNSYPAKVQITSSLSKLVTEYLVMNLTGDPGWANEGVESKLLKVGSSGWVKGKIRFKVVLEFCPKDFHE